MKAAKIILVILVISALIGWVRGGHGPEHIAKTLPFCGGHRPGLYDLGGLAMLGLCLWGLARLRNARQADETEEELPLEETQEDPVVEEDDDQTSQRQQDDEQQDDQDGSN